MFLSILISFFFFSFLGVKIFLTFLFHQIFTSYFSSLMLLSFSQSFDPYHVRLGRKECLPMFHQSYQTGRSIIIIIDYWFILFFFRVFLLFRFSIFNISQHFHLNPFFLSPFFFFSFSFVIFLSFSLFLL